MTMTQKPVSEKGKLLFAKAGPDGKSLGDCPFTQKANLALRFGGMEFDVCCIDVSNKPKWFLELTKAGTTPAFQNGDDVLEDSEDIVKLSDEMGTSDTTLIRPEEALWNEGEQVVSKVFPAFVAFLKNKDTAKEEEVKKNLSDTICEVGAFLSKTGGKFLLGDEVSSLDCKLAPVLHHTMVAGKHYKGYDVGSVSGLVSQYMDNMRVSEEWKPTACDDATIVWGWSKFFK
ncbi:unnamed protein product [Agarophyton chilense]